MECNFSFAQGSLCDLAGRPLGPFFFSYTHWGTDIPSHFYHVLTKSVYYK
jgi:hypothetical protein